MQETHGAYTVSMGIVVLGVTILYSQHQRAICATVAIRRDAQVRHMKCWKRRQRKAWSLRIAVIFAAKVSHGMSDGRLWISEVILSTVLCHPPWVHVSMGPS